MYTIIVYQTKETQNTQRGLRQMETDKSHDEKWKQHYQQCREKKANIIMEMSVKTKKKVTEQKWIEYTFKNRGRRPSVQVTRLLLVLWSLHYHTAVACSCFAFDIIHVRSVGDDFHPFASTRDRTEYFVHFNSL